MPVPKRGGSESKSEFLSRCMSDEKMNSEYPEGSQRYAVCMSGAKGSLIQQVSDVYEENAFGSEEIIFDESLMYIPEESEYEDFGDGVEEYTVAAKPGLWENIRDKRKREGKNYKPAKPGDPDRPSKDAWKKAQSSGCPLATQNIQVNLQNREICVAKANYGPANPTIQDDAFWSQKASLFKTTVDTAKTMLCGNCAAFIQTPSMMDCIKNGIDPEGDGYAEQIVASANLGYCELFDFKCAGDRTCDAWIVGGPVTFAKAVKTIASLMDYAYNSREEAMSAAKRMGLDGVFSHTRSGKTYWFPGSEMEELEDWIEVEEEIAEAKEKSQKKVKLNNPFRTPDGPKKFSVYVKNDKGNIVKVNFGDPNMSIKRDDPESRRGFRARHQCDTNPGPKWKARYWSCKFWSKTSVTDLT